MVSEDFSKLWNKLSRDWKLTLEQELSPLTEGQLNILELLLECSPMKAEHLICSSIYQRLQLQLQQSLIAWSAMS